MAPSTPSVSLAKAQSSALPISGWQPYDAATVSRWVRWPNNLAIVALNTALLRVIFPTAAVGVALLGEQRGWGLLNALAIVIPCPRVVGSDGRPVGYGGGVWRKERLLELERDGPERSR